MASDQPVDSPYPALLTFEHEFEAIASTAIRDAALHILNTRTPKYFYYVRSSPTGKHHPPDEQKHGGLVLHTKRVFWIARDLCRIFQLTEVDRDEVLAASLIHDIYCRGPFDEPEPNTVTDHEMLVEYILKALLLQPEYHFITICKAHAGRWGPSPITTMQQLILHIADNIASRPNVTVDVENTQET